MATIGRVKRAHVNQLVIRQNAKNGTSFPALTMKVGSENHYAHEIEFLGGCRIVSNRRDTSQLSCGARVWLESTAPALVKFRRCSVYENGVRLTNERVVS